MSAGAAIIGVIIWIVFGAIVGWIASLIMGVLWEKINPPTAFRFGAILALVAALLLGLAMPSGRTDVPDRETGRSS